MAELTATCIRTQQVGGGYCYDVYWRKDQKQYEPIAFGCYASVIVRNGVEYYRTDDMFRTPEIDNLEVGHLRSIVFRGIDAYADKVERRILTKAFDELKGKTHIPLFNYFDEELPNKTVELTWEIMIGEV